MLFLAHSQRRSLSLGTQVQAFAKRLLLTSQPERLQNAFVELFPVPLSPSDPASSNSEDTNSSPPFIYIAITTQDASIVYYKLSQGIVKPSV